MGYDEIKTDMQGQRYAGMRIGGEHSWRYAGEWCETKVAPDQWGIRFEAVKHRRVEAPTSSGAVPGATFDWLIIARQIARKADANTYQTLLEGVKWKVGSRFPTEPVFSYERRGVQEADVVRAYLDETADLLRAHKVPGISQRPEFSQP